MSTRPSHRKRLRHLVRTAYSEHLTRNDWRIDDGDPERIKTAVRAAAGAELFLLDELLAAAIDAEYRAEDRQRTSPKRRAYINAQDMLFDDDHLADLWPLGEQRRVRAEHAREADCLQHAQLSTVNRQAVEAADDVLQDTMGAVLPIMREAPGRTYGQALRIYRERLGPPPGQLV
jgi:hypothetical protein